MVTRSSPSAGRNTCSKVFHRLSGPSGAPAGADRLTKSGWISASNEARSPLAITSSLNRRTTALMASVDITRSSLFATSHYTVCLYSLRASIGTSPGGLRHSTRVALAQCVANTVLGRIADRCPIARAIRADDLRRVDMGQQQLCVARQTSVERQEEGGDVAAVRRRPIDASVGGEARIQRLGGVMASCVVVHVHSVEVACGKRVAEVIRDV